MSNRCNMLGEQTRMSLKFEICKWTRCRHRFNTEMSRPKWGGSVHTPRRSDCKQYLGFKNGGPVALRSRNRGPVRGYLGDIPGIFSRCSRSPKKGLGGLRDSVPVMGKASSRVDKHNIYFLTYHVVFQSNDRVRIFIRSTALLIQ